MKKTKTNDDLQTDDEVTRTQGMISGTTKASRWTLRATCATEVSWMQRNRILEPAMDILWRASAFAYLHSAPKPEIRSVVNSHDDFVQSVDEWMDQNNPNADEIKMLANAMNERISEWFSSASESDSPASPGN